MFEFFVRLSWIVGIGHEVSTGESSLWRVSVEGLGGIFGGIGNPETVDVFEICEEAVFGLIGDGIDISWYGTRLVLFGLIGELLGGRLSVLLSDEPYWTVS